MLLVAEVKKDKQSPMNNEQETYFGLDKLNIPRSVVPAITHVDYSARIQSVNRKTNPRYHKMLTVFKKKYGCPIVVNTSFNINGQPNCENLEDAYHTYELADLDFMFIDSKWLIHD